MYTKRNRRLGIVILATLILAATSCVPTWKVYTSTFSRSTTLKIQSTIEDNSNTIGGGGPAVAGLICKYTVEIIPVTATCVAAVLAGYWRLKDVMGQIERSSTRKCLKLEFHIPLLPFPSTFMNVFPARCLPDSPLSTGGSGWDLQPSGGDTGGGGSW